MGYLVVNKRTDTWEVNVKVLLSQKDQREGVPRLPDHLEEQLETYQHLAKEAESEVATKWAFQGQTLFCYPHGAGHGWRYILHSPDLHLHIGRGKLNENIIYARFSSLLLHALDEADVLSSFCAFVAGMLGHVNFILQVREFHRCIDIAGWELTQADEERFVTRGCLHDYPAEEMVFIPEATGKGRKRRQFDFSKSGHHSCCIYDKTREVKVSGKEWLYEVWKGNGWDGESKVIRGEFRYDRDCCREMGIEDPYSLLDQFDSTWAYSTQQWLRHTKPSLDRNQSRWETSEVWALVQTAMLSKPDPVPAVRQKKIEADARRALAGFVGFGVSLAVRSGLSLQTADETGEGFMTWAQGKLETYLSEAKAATFTELMQDRALRLGIPLRKD